VASLGGNEVLGGAEEFQLERSRPTFGSSTQQLLTHNGLANCPFHSLVFVRSSARAGTLDNS